MVSNGTQPTAWITAVGVLAAASVSAGSAAGQGPAPVGNPSGNVPVPAAGRAVDTSRPTRTIGTGTPASCTSRAVVGAVARGGIITFNCGPAPVTIVMSATAKVRNTSPRVVIDGGGLVTLSGAGRRRILYMNTCDRSLVWTTSHCQDQATPQLVVQNLGFVAGNAGGRDLVGGGGAIYARGGRLTVINATFSGNRCAPTGPDVGGGAIRVFDQYRDRPVFVVQSTFGGAAGQGNTCSNGGALSSIGVPWVVVNSLFSHNRAVGRGANPARPGTPGGGNGGAIALDGNRFSLTLAGTSVEDNVAREGGGAVFFVSNNRAGTMLVDRSVLRRNRSLGFETRGFPGIFFLGARPPTVRASTISR